MRILVDILHPKQAHVFRPLVAHWRARGDEVRIVTRDKEITHRLLDRFGLDYQCLSVQRRGLGLGVELVERWIKMFVVLRRFRPHVTISMVGMSTALPSRLLGIPNIAITDTETARMQNRIGLPFADRILTPEWFRLDLGPRHHRYRGYHEWSYLDPAVFTPDPEVVRGAGIDPEAPYAVVRLVGWGAAHDWGERGFTSDQRIALVRGLAARMRVVLSMESAPPAELAPYLTAVPVESMHHVLAFSRLVVGESPTMATEASLLGITTVLASSWAGGCGNMQVLEERFGLMRVFERGSDALAAALEIARNPPSPAAVRARRARLVEDLVSMPEMIDGHIRDLVGDPDG